MQVSKGASWLVLRETVYSGQVLCSRTFSSFRHPPEEEEEVKEDAQMRA